MIHEVVMPKLGMTMTEARLVKWLCGEGDRVEKGQELLEIETEKVTYHVEAPATGILAKIIVAEGEHIPVGRVVGLIADTVEEVSEEVLAAYGRGEPGATMGKVAEGKAGKEEKESPRLNVSPVARRLAEEKGVDLSLIKGSGPGGRIVKEDVLRVLAAVTASTGSPGEGGEEPPRGPSPAHDVVQLTGIEQVMGRRMSQSWAEIPQFSLTIRVNVTEPLAYVLKLKEEGLGVSITDFVHKAVAVALRKHPHLNARLQDQSLLLFRQVDLGFAVDTSAGLVVPVIRSADQKGLVELAAERRLLVEKAGENRLSVDDVADPTFTVSNLGMFGIQQFTPIVNPPNVAILGLGEITRCQASNIPWLTCTLAVDHRAVSGAPAARFLAEFKRLLEQPWRLVV